MAKLTKPIRIPDDTRAGIDQLITDAGYMPRIIGANGILPDALAAMVIVCKQRPTVFASTLRSIRADIGRIPIETPAPAASPRAARAKAVRR